jgi:glutathione peroxidase-family protein
MSFKKLRSVKKTYDQQGLIYFTCKNFKKLSEQEQEKIKMLCENVGGEYSSALFELMTTSKSVINISMTYYVSTNVLYTLRAKFYDKW